MSKRRSKRPRHAGPTPNLTASTKAPASLGLAIILCVLVTAVVAATHWTVLDAQALSFDDAAYVTKNQLVQTPSWDSAWSFFTEVLRPTTVPGYYQPLTMVSLMIDWGLGGRPEDLEPFHRTSLALHVINTALIIGMLWLLFSDPWAAALAGLLFGVHPITVEPIPWIGERKTLLAAFFSLLMLISYLLYIRQRERRWYAAVVAGYALALLSKPTSTPLPLLLLVLDYWPLRRLSKSTVKEKLPLFVLGGISAIITLVSQARSAALTLPGQEGPNHAPLLQVCYCVFFYPAKIFWPVNLTSHYPFPEPFSLENLRVVACVVGAVLWVAALFFSARWTRAPLAGWLFFFLAILPTLGVVGFTNVVASDKYVYLPLVGFLLILAGGLARLRRARPAVVGLVAILAAAEIHVTRAQISRWRDTETLHRHMIALAPRAAGPRLDLGYYLVAQGRRDEATAMYQEALALAPADVSIINHFGNSYLRQGRLDEAIRCFSEVIRLRDDFPDAHNGLGVALGMKEQPSDALPHFERALALRPTFAAAWVSRGTALIQLNRGEEAVASYRRALELEPGLIDAQVNLAHTLQTQGELSQALEAVRRQITSDPGDANARFFLAVGLQEQDREAEARAAYTEVLRIEPYHAAALSRLRAMDEQAK